VVPANRRYLIRLRIDRAEEVTVEGHGMLPRVSAPSGNSAAWWEDRNGFIVIRPPFRPTLAVTVT